MILWVEKNDLFRSSFCFHSHLNVRALGLGIVYKQYNNSRTQKPTFIMPDKIQRLDGTVICCWFMSLYEKFKRSLLSTGTELTNGIVTHTFECSYTRLSIHHYNTEISITTSYHFRNGPVLELLRAPNSLNPRQQSDRISSVLRVPNLKKQTRQKQNTNQTGKREVETKAQAAEARTRTKPNFIAFHHTCNMHVCLQWASDNA